MLIRITKEGELQIKRGDTDIYTAQMCPYYDLRYCTDRCALFGEPYHDDDGALLLHLCGGKVHDCTSIKDERVGRELSA